MRLEQEQKEPDTEYEALEVAHIIPYWLIPTSNNDNPDSVSKFIELPSPRCSSDRPVQTDRSGSALTYLEEFAGFSILDEVNADKINHPRNSLTLTTLWHQEFDKLNIAFEALPNDPNTYRIHRYGPIAMLPLPPQHEKVKFVARGGIEVPNPRLLALRAACAKVFSELNHKQGISEELRELEETRTLSADGSSSRLLHFALTAVFVE